MIQDGWRIKGHVGELAEWRKVVFTVLVGSTDPTDRPRNDEIFGRVVRQS